METTKRPNSASAFGSGSLSYMLEDPSRHRLWSRIEVWIAVFTTSAILLHLAARFAFRLTPAWYLAPLYAVLVIGGLPLLVNLSRRLLARDFGSDLIAGVSIVTAVILGEYLVASIVVLMLSGGAALEQCATRRSSAVLGALARRMPLVAHRKSDSGVTDLHLNEVRIGDILVIFPHEICPVDGSVVEGQGLMDEAYLTGEPFVIPKAPGSQVISGAVNGDTALTIVASKLPVDSRYARVMQVMRASEQNRPRLRRVGDQLGAWYTPVTLVLAVAAWLLSGQQHRFLAVMVIATPCPLLISIPVAVIGAISLSAARGIIIKNPAVLEQIDLCRTLIFDKTGTLTYGKPALTEVLCSPPFERDDVLIAAASLERFSKHPLAGAILDAASASNLTLQSVTQLAETPGQGLTGIVAGKQVSITGRASITGHGRAQTAGHKLPPIAGGLECVVIIEGVYAALFRFRDAPRRDSDIFVRHLRPSHQVDRVLLVSGDRESEVRYLAESVGIAEVHASQSPEQKLAIVEQETRLARTLFVGDGINDAPALMAATVGVAFGQSSDVTAEAADAVILESSLRKVDELIHIGRRMRSIALQSAVGGLALSIVGMIAAAAGFLPPIAGAVAQELIDLASVLNALRVVLPASDLTDF
jgi:heavy metal translocating P-type ATPase